MSVVKSGLVFLTILGLSFGGNPTDILKDAFSITRPKVVTDPDSSLAFNCKLAVGSFFDTCKIITDQGELLLVNMTTGSVSNNDTQALVIEGLTGIITDEDDVCGLNFTKFSDYGFGSWSCLMESGNEAFHQGTFYLLESGTWPKDIRLPEHLMVSKNTGSARVYSNRNIFFLNGWRRKVRSFVVRKMNFTNWKKFTMTFSKASH
jgi:hypothetical protein